MKGLFCALFLLLGLTGITQVSVKGYYRKNGTYVQPHMRSSPDGNPYNNYSFPGNTNPYTGKTATGSPETYLNNYYKRNETSSIPPRQGLQPTIFKFQGTIKTSAPLRLNPRDNSSEILMCKSGDTVFILEESNDSYYKVDVNGFNGFLSKNFVSLNGGANINLRQNNISTSTQVQQSQYSITPSQSLPPVKFIYETKIKENVTPSLRLNPRDNSDEIYKCRSGEKVYILENAGNSYYKVNVHGFTGYLRRDFMP